MTALEEIYFSLRTGVTVPSAAGNENIIKIGGQNEKTVMFDDRGHYDDPDVGGRFCG